MLPINNKDSEIENLINETCDLLFDLLIDKAKEGRIKPQQVINFTMNVLTNLLGNVAFFGTDEREGYAAYVRNAREAMEALQQWFEHGLQVKLNELSEPKNEEVQA